MKYPALHAAALWLHDVAVLLPALYFPCSQSLQADPPSLNLPGPHVTTIMHVLKCGGGVRTQLRTTQSWWHSVYNNHFTSCGVHAHAQWNETEESRKLTDNFGPTSSVLSVLSSTTENTVSPNSFSLRNNTAGQPTIVQQCCCCRGHDHVYHAACTRLPEHDCQRKSAKTITKQTTLRSLRFLTPAPAPFQ